MLSFLLMFRVSFSCYSSNSASISKSSVCATGGKKGHEHGIIVFGWRLSEGSYNLERLGHRPLFVEMSENVGTDVSSGSIFDIQLWELEAW